VSKLTVQLKAVKVYNEYDFAQDGQAYIWRANGSDWGYPSWVVSRRGWRTANHGDGEFHIPSVSQRAEVLEKAKAWASERYDIKDWKRTPFGGWMDAEFVTKRLQELKVQIREREATA